MSESKEKAKRENFLLFRKLIVIAVLMFGFGWALIPVYKAICEVTGVNFLTRKEENVVAPDNSQIDKSRKITVEFDSNSQGPWRFRPTVASVELHPGEVTQVVYEVVNTQNRTIDGQAIPSYAPQQSGQFFKKLECFCFNQQTLGPNEAQQMPIVFYIDPAIPKSIETITLSYTFFEIAGKN